MASGTNSKNIFCPKHPTETLKFLCVPCKKKICIDCKLEAHDGHKPTLKIDDHPGGIVKKSPPNLNATQPLGRNLMDGNLYPKGSDNFRPKESDNFRPKGSEPVKLPEPAKPKPKSFLRGIRSKVESKMTTIKSAVQQTGEMLSEWASEQVGLMKEETWSMNWRQQKSGQDKIVPSVQNVGVKPKQDVAGRPGPPRRPVPQLPAATGISTTAPPLPPIRQPSRKFTTFKASPAIPPDAADNDDDEGGWDDDWDDDWDGDDGDGDDGDGDVYVPPDDGGVYENVDPKMIAEVCRGNNTAAKKVGGDDDDKEWEDVDENDHNVYESYENTWPAEIPPPIVTDTPNATAADVPKGSPEAASALEPATMDASYGVAGFSALKIQISDPPLPPLPKPYYGNLYSDGMAELDSSAKHESCYVHMSGSSSVREDDKENMNGNVQNLSASQAKLTMTSPIPPPKYLSVRTLGVPSSPSSAAAAAAGTPSSPQRSPLKSSNLSLADQLKVALQARSNGKQ